MRTWLGWAGLRERPDAAMPREQHAAPIRRLPEYNIHDAIRPPRCPVLMLKCLMLQEWNSLSDPGPEDALTGGAHGLNGAASMAGLGGACCRSGGGLVGWWGCRSERGGLGPVDMWERAGAAAGGGKVSENVHGQC